MNIQNSEILFHAKKSLSGQWTLAIMACAVYFILTSVPAQLQGMGGLATLLISGPMACFYEKVNQQDNQGFHVNN